MSYFNNDHEPQTIAGVIAAVALVALVASCDTEAADTYAEIAVGQALNMPWSRGLDGSHYAWKGGGPTIEFIVGHQFTKNLAVEYSHTSNTLAGFPFNDKKETSLDRVQLKYRIDLF